MMPYSQTTISTAMAVVIAMSSTQASSQSSQPLAEISPGFSPACQIDKTICFAFSTKLPRKIGDVFLKVSDFEISGYSGVTNDTQLKPGRYILVSNEKLTSEYNTGNLPPRAIVRPLPYDISIGDMLNVGDTKSGHPIMSLESFQARNPKLRKLDVDDIVQKGTIVILVIGE